MPSLPRKRHSRSGANGLASLRHVLPRLSARLRIFWLRWRAAHGSAMFICTRNWPAHSACGSSPHREFDRAAGWLGVDETRSEVMVADMNVLKGVGHDLGIS